MNRVSSGDAQNLIKNAWEAHARGDDETAEQFFRQALADNPDSIETMYGLAIVLKASGRHREAIHVFEDIIRKIESQEWEDRDRIRMLRRFALGQVNFLRNQDWNLEREVWQR